MTVAAAVEPGLSPEAIKRYLHELKEVCAGTPVVDCHVHATEVIRDEIRYGGEEGGIYAASEKYDYKPPAIAAARLEAGALNMKPERQNRLSEMAFTRTYQHTGPKVLLDQMDLAVVDRAVLLPVAHSEESLQRQMQVIDDCSRNSDRLIPGYSIPESVQSDDIEEVLRAGMEQHHIQVVKVHGNVCGIDLGANAGVARINAILEACGNLGLPVLVHGGCSPILGECPASRFSTIEKLANVDWSASPCTVVIAHFGVYGCGETPEGVPQDVLQAVEQLLEDHPNILLDTSGVGFAAVFDFLKHIASDRLIFGSDAMYVPMYRQIVYIMHAFELLSLDREQLRTVVSENALRMLDQAGRN